MTNITARMDELTGDRRPFVHALVVRAQEPTSARAGDAAIILDDGSIEGFVGGQCAESSVRAAALDTLRDGRSLLLRVLPDDEVGFPDSPGALVVVNPCHSGGAVEIFLKPMIPAPVLRLVGATPISEAVATLAEFLDFTVERGPGDGGWEQATAVVVASLGKAEEPSIRAALDAGVGYIGLVASRRRGSMLLDEMGLSTEDRARVHTPAGVDIGARTAKEIALSIMGEVVRAIRVDGLAAPSTAASGVPAARTVDPVCGMTVVVGPDTPTAMGRYFCCAGCRDTYVAQAGSQASSQAGSQAGSRDGSAAGSRDGSQAGSRAGGGS